jgi:oligopeptide/dipeptide ABC transporter ATP-binding protein
VSGEHLLQVRDLKKYFEVHSMGGDPFKKDIVHAVDGVDLQIEKGTTLGLVGESGCGKTTLGRCILRLIEPTSGTIIFEGCDITRISKKQMRHLRKDMQVIFQDPYSSLDPRMKVGDIVGEPFTFFGIPGGGSKSERIEELLNAVGLDPAVVNRFPHEFSGGQRARICIARALALRPKFIVADEPVSSLDVSIRAQILNLLKDMRTKLNLVLLYISHDLSTLKFISDHVAVMYLGKIVETGPVRDIFKDPKHPYTQALMSSVPVPNPSLRRNRVPVKGELPSPIRPPTGCRFHPRCFKSMDVCHRDVPEFSQIGKNHWVSCFLY